MRNTFLNLEKEDHLVPIPRIIALSCVFTKLQHTSNYTKRSLGPLVKEKAS